MPQGSAPSIHCPWEHLNAKDGDWGLSGIENEDFQCENVEDGDFPTNDDI